MQITLITGNAQKAKDISAALDFPVKHIALDLPELQALDLPTIVKDKAEKAWASVGEGYVLVEDVGLRFHAFDKLPGPFIKWFYKKLHNEGLIKLLEGFVDRRASAEICYDLYDGKTHQLFEGRTGGRIAAEPLGGQGYGWAAIFIPNGHEQTWGQMSAEDRDKTSMRNRALTKLKIHLQSSR